MRCVLRSGDGVLDPRRPRRERRSRRERCALPPRRPGRVRGDCPCGRETRGCSRSSVARRPTGRGRGGPRGGSRLRPRVDLAGQAAPGTVRALPPCASRTRRPPGGRRTADGGPGASAGTPGAVEVRRGGGAGAAAVRGLRPSERTDPTARGPCGAPRPAMAAAARPPGGCAASGTGRAATASRAAPTMRHSRRVRSRCVPGLRLECPHKGALGTRSAPSGTARHRTPPGPRTGRSRGIARGTGTHRPMRSAP